MAKRYIEANALIQDIEQSRANNNHNNSIASQTHNAEHKKFIKMVLEQPTADVVEVKRGHWIKKFKYSHGYDDYYNTECSLCGYKVEKSGVGDKLSLDNFCPNCGADMRGEEK